MHRFLTRYDVILCPVTAYASLPVEYPIGRDVRRFHLHLRIQPDRLASGGREGRNKLGWCSHRRPDRGTPLAGGRVPCCRRPFGACFGRMEDA